MSGASLAPAAMPKSVRLYPISESAATPLGWATPGIYVPATVRDGWISEPDRIELNGDLKEPMIPLVLAKVTVDKRGNATAVQMLATRDRKADDWFGRFVAGLRFVPAARGGEIVVSDTLVLIRAVHEGVPSGHSAPPANDAWVKQYVSGLATGDVPFVNLLYFLPANIVDPRSAPAQANLFQYESVGTEWGSNVLHYTADSGGRVILDWYRGNEHPARIVRRK